MTINIKNYEGRVYIMGVLQRRYSYYQHSSKFLTPFVTMKKKIKTWLIHLLGGVTVEESKNSGKYNPDTLQVEPVKPTCPFKPFDKVLIRDSKKQIWIANYFSLYNEEDKDYPYVCMGGSYRYCIPYNEHTAHLLGTSEAYTEGGSE